MEFVKVASHQIRALGPMTGVLMRRGESRHSGMWGQRHGGRPHEGPRWRIAGRPRSRRQRGPRTADL